MGASDRLDEIKERLAAATPGPWYCQENNVHNVINIQSNIPMEITAESGSVSETIISLIIAHVQSVHAFQNSRFIANAPDDIVWLINTIHGYADTICDLGKHIKEQETEIKRLTKADEIPE